MDLTKKVPWVFPAGIELTWLPKNYEVLHKKQGEEWNGPLQSQLNRDARSFNNIARKLELELEHVHNDCGHCVEAPTTILKSWSVFKTTYNNASKIAASLNLVPNLDYAVSGMGHIHVGGLTNREKLWALKDMANRPYVSWALVHPSDDINARPLALQVVRNFDRSVPSSWWEDRCVPKNPKPFASYEDDLNLPFWKNFIFRTNANVTVEWRAFDAPTNWDEQVRQMALVQAYFAYVRRGAEGDYPTVKFYHDREEQPKEWLKSWTLDQAAQGWKMFIEMLGLPIEEYEYWIDQNMTPRFEWGNRL